jgi:hypothetical protein
LRCFGADAWLTFGAGIGDIGSQELNRLVIVSYGFELRGKRLTKISCPPAAL